jgi:hypothetical protein
VSVVAGAAVIVSTGAGVASGIIVAVSVVVVSSSVVLPQEATKTPIARARMLNFTNFMTLFLKVISHLYPVQKKVTRYFPFFLTKLIF